MLTPGRERQPPPSSFLSTLVTYPRWVPRFDSSPDRGQLNVPTLPTGTHSVRTAGATVLSPAGAPRPIPFVPSAPSTTPGPCTAAPTPPPLVMAMLRLFQVVTLPHRPTASTAGGTILLPIGIAKAARHRLLSGVQVLPPRSCPRRPLATRWTRPATTGTSRSALHPPAPSSRRSRWLLQGPEGQRYFRPL